MSRFVGICLVRSKFSTTAGPAAAAPLSFFFACSRGRELRKAAAGLVQEYALQQVGERRYATDR